MSRNPDWDDWDRNLGYEQVADDVMLRLGTLKNSEDSLSGITAHTSISQDSCASTDSLPPIGSDRASRLHQSYKKRKKKKNKNKDKDPLLKHNLERYCLGYLTWRQMVIVMVVVITVFFIALLIGLILKFEAPRTQAACDPCTTAFALTSFCQNSNGHEWDEIWSNDTETACQLGDNDDLCALLGNAGVGCDQDGDIISIELSDNALSGSISPDISTIATLKILDLSHNSLRGTVPHQISDMKLDKLFLAGSDSLTYPDYSTWATITDVADTNPEPSGGVDPLTVALPILAIAILMLIITWLYLRYKRRRYIIPQLGQTKKLYNYNIVE